jgi:hypothetical protein
MFTAVVKVKNLANVGDRLPAIQVKPRREKNVKCQNGCNAHAADHVCLGLCIAVSAIWHSLPKTTVEPDAVRSWELDLIHAHVARYNRMLWIG